MLNQTHFDSQLAEFLAASHWLVGFSGGVDSTVLLYLLHDWCAANPDAPPLSAIHINHGIQTAATDWGRHCEGVCKTLNVPLVTQTVSIQAGASGEAAAREVRYQVFTEQLQPGAVLFLAHHLDDQVETFFLRLMRGAGVEGLAAIPYQRSLGEGTVVRPLLEVSRREIEDHAESRAIGYVEDPSNSSPAIDRNFLRLELLPLLASRWPAYRQSVARASRHMASAVALAGEDAAPETLLNKMGDPGLQQSELISGSAAMGVARLRAWLRAGGYQAPDQASVEEFVRQLRSAASDASPRLVCSAYTLQRYRDVIYLLPELAVVSDGAARAIESGGCLEVAGLGNIRLQRTSGSGLRLNPGETLSVCWRSGGERCRLLGRSGHRSLKHLMQEWDIPPWWRGRIPLLYLEEEMLAVGDLAYCDSSRWSTKPEEGEYLWNISWERPVNSRSV